MCPQRMPVTLKLVATVGDIGRSSYLYVRVIATAILLFNVDFKLRNSACFNIVFRTNRVINMSSIGM